MLSKMLCDEANACSLSHYHSRRVIIYRWKTPIYEDATYKVKVSDYIRVTIVEGERHTLDRAEAMYTEYGDPEEYGYSTHHL